MENTFIVWLEEHGHGPGRQEEEIRSILTVFPAIYDKYAANQEQFGAGVIIYAPEHRRDAGFAPMDGMPESQGMTDMILKMRELTPDMNHVPVVFIYTCGHVSGYVLTGAYSLKPSEPSMARVVSEVYGELHTVKPPKFVGETPSSPEPWDLEL